jgi:signal transduction histidine kinase
LKTFTSITVNHYEKTLRNLYTSLEYVTSHDARHLSDAGKANVRRAQSAIQKLRLLTNDLVTYARLHELDTGLTAVDLNDVMAKVLRELTPKIEQPGARITVAALPTIQGYPLLLSSLFYHLLENAIKFAKPGIAPLIEVSYTHLAEMNNNPAALKDTPYAVISVADNGIGFPDSQAEKIFELFYRLQEKGTYKGSGVGLSICRKIMTLHEGYIVAKSTPDTGSVFTCYFPLERS